MQKTINFEIIHPPEEKENPPEVEEHYREEMWQ